MKRISALILVTILGLTLLAGCGRIQDSSHSDGESENDHDPAKAMSSIQVNLEALGTIGDARAIVTDESQYGYVEDTYMYAFKVGDMYYRVTAALPADVKEQLEALDMSAEDYQVKEEEIVAPLQIETREKLNDKQLSKKDLEKLVGKTGKELLDDDWVSTGYDLDQMEFFYQKGIFEYTVTYDGKLEYSDDFDENEAVKPLKVKSVKCTGLGDALQLEE